MALVGITQICSHGIDNSPEFLTHISNSLLEISMSYLFTELYTWKIKCIVFPRKYMPTPIISLCSRLLERYHLPAHMKGLELWSHHVTLILIISNNQVLLTLTPKNLSSPLIHSLGSTSALVHIVIAQLNYYNLLSLMASPSTHLSCCQQCKLS